MAGGAHAAFTGAERGELLEDPGATQNHLEAARAALDLPALPEALLDLAALRTRGERAAAFNTARKEVEQAAFELFATRDKELLRIFAAYMSSSIQNALDAIRARAQARMDDLTGLANSRYFHTRLAEEITRADREGTELAMLFIDLDRFKAVNDLFGHLAGSWTLHKVARLLSDNAPPASLVARYGGDEFVVILPGADLTRATQAAETLRSTIAGAAFFDSDPENRQTPTALPRVTASIGISSYREHLAPGGTQRRRESTFLRLADSAMYRAKAAGRNRVEVADPED